MYWLRLKVGKVTEIIIDLLILLKLNKQSNSFIMKTLKEHLC